MTKQEISAQLSKSLTKKELEALLEVAKNHKKDGGTITTSRKPNFERDPNSTSGKIRALLEKGVPPMDVAEKLKVRPQFVYNVRARM
jgi:hypothetical protein